MKKKVGIIGQFPPPMHGLSKAVDTLYNSYLSKEFEFIKIDITNNKMFLCNFFKILIGKLDLYYLTISQSKFGNVRDLIIIELIKLKKSKIIIHLHGGGFRKILDNEFSTYQRKINYRILSKVDGGIVLGESLTYIFEGIIPKDRIYIVRNCVDDEFVISDNEFNEKIKLLKSKNKFKILYLSNFIKEKGYGEVLKIAKLCKEKNDNRFEFIFAGKFFNKEDEKEFFEYIKKNNLTSIINYRGVVSGREKLNILKESDLFILLTKYKNEGQPISIIEAAANGLMIVTTNHAGIMDILGRREMIIAEKNDINSVEILNDIIDKYEKREAFITLIKKNRKYILKSFSRQIYLENLKNVFNFFCKC